MRMDVWERARGWTLIKLSVGSQIDLDMDLPVTQITVKLKLENQMEIDLVF